MSNSSTRWMTATFLTTALMVAATAGAAPKETKKPYPHYWLSIATVNQSMPGMPAEMTGMAGLFGGKSSFGPKRELLLQLESPQTTPEKPSAQDEIPPGQKMGAALPLVTPKVEKTPHEQGERRPPEQYEKPKARMLIYWGCGENIGKGQPKVIDTSKMGMAEFGQAFSGRTPTHQTPPAPRKGWTYGEWPNRDDRTDIPADSSLVGAHRVKGNYTIDIPFSLDAKRDFMAPVEFTSISSTAGTATKVDWKEVPTAIGYFATAMGHNQSTGETIFWSASEVPETGFALLDYLTPADVSRFIKDKVVMPTSRTTCTVPPVFKDAEGAMLQFIAYGEELNLAHPPKPKLTRQP
ncbi:MAG: hypothetical protein HY888_11930, partial [Deltaproteobacteria bacterium]|nr:hypothetical protein [Deltaproteobacteria bacterium]